MNFEFNSKADARKHFFAIRSAINENERKQKSLAICKKIIALPQFSSCDTLFIYSPIKSEADPTYLFDEAKKRGIRVAFPISITDNFTPDFRLVTSLDELSLGTYGIREPRSDAEKATFSTRSICVVPALAFDSFGNRLGYGKGFYDRFLNDFAGLTIGITYTELKCDRLPTQSTDIPVDIIITDKESVKTK